MFYLYLLKTHDFNRVFTNVKALFLFEVKNVEALLFLKFIKQKVNQPINQRTKIPKQKTCISVNQHDYSELDSEMDERDSIYLDTISLASEYPNRKSMSLSRQTIYHSAEDVQGNATSDANNLFKQNEQYDGHAAGQMAYGKYGHNDEVSARLLILNNKKTVTYSQWKSRVTISL